MLVVNKFDSNRCRLRSGLTWGRGLLSATAALLFSLPLAVPPEALAGDTLYVVPGRRGSVTFTTRPQSSRYSYRFVSSRRPLKSRLIRHRGSASGSTPAKAVNSRFDSLIAAAAKKQELDPALVKAVVHAESSFNPRARSHKGAMGLMQLMPGTAKRFGVKDAYHPAQNVSGGTKYLRLLLRRYDGDERLALAAYNAGEGVVDKLKRIPPYRETINFVNRVQSLRRLYSCVAQGQQSC